MRRPWIWGSTTLDGKWQLPGTQLFPTARNAMVFTTGWSHPRWRPDKKKGVIGWMRPSGRLCFCKINKRRNFGAEKGKHQRNYWAISNLLAYLGSTRQMASEIRLLSVATGRAGICSLPVLLQQQQCDWLRFDIGQVETPFPLHPIAIDTSPSFDNEKDITCCQTLFAAKQHESNLIFFPATVPMEIPLLEIKHLESLPNV